MAVRERDPVMFVIIGEENEVGALVHDMGEFRRRNHGIILVKRQFACGSPFAGASPQPVLQAALADTSSAIVEDTDASAPRNAASRCSGP